MTKRLKLNHQSVHLAALKTYVHHYCHGLHFAKTALGAIRSRNWIKLVQVAGDVDETLRNLGTWSGTGPTDVWAPYSADEFCRASQFVAMVTKYPFDQEQIPGLNPDAAAIKKFRANERRNRRVNAVLRAYRSRGLDRHPSHEIMRSWILKVMGSKPDFEYIYNQSDFSSGASLGVHGKATHFGNKVEKQLTCTPTALKYFTRAVLSNEQLHLYYTVKAREGRGEVVPLGATVCLLTPGELRDYFEGVVRLVQEDKLSCAAKKFDCSRTVGTPPTCNTFIQKGADKMMRRNLKDRANLDLSRQDVNQWMARKGATEGELIPYVTLDVKGASDSVLLEIVRTLYSDDWFAFLNDIRSPGYVLPDGSRHRFELFCSMGNGFCFPLETSIFAAACVAACKMAGSPVDFRVYGDDIIVRQDVALLLCEILRSLGFRLNLDKSFIHGPFRESCGANWHGELDVTPAFWRRRITSRSELHAIHNAHSRHPEVQEVLRQFDPTLPCCVPDTAQYDFVTDQAFRVTQDLCMAHSAVWRRDTQSFRYRMLVSSPVSDDSIPAEDRWVRLRQISALRGSTFEEAFLLRRSVRYHMQLVSSTAPECNYSSVRSIRAREAAWSSSPPEQHIHEHGYPWVVCALRGALSDVSRANAVRRARGPAA